MRQLRETNHGPQNRLATRVRHILCLCGLTFSGNSCNHLSLNTMTCKMHSSLVCCLSITFYKSSLWLITSIMANLKGLIMATWVYFVLTGNEGLGFSAIFTEVVSTYNIRGRQCDRCLAWRCRCIRHPLAFKGLRLHSGGDN